MMHRSTRAFFSTSHQKLASLQRASRVCSDNKSNSSGSSALTQKIIATPEEENVLLGRFLQFKLGMSASAIDRLIRKNNIWLRPANTKDHKKVKHLSPLTPVYAGDHIFVKTDKVDRINPEAVIRDMAQFAPVEEEQIEKLRKSLLYCDENILALNKPNNMVVQGGAPSENSLYRLLDLLKFELRERPRFVHRLDKQTTGVLLLARNQKSAATLSAALRRSAEFQEDRETERNVSIHREYRAILTGVPKELKGTIDSYLYLAPETEVDISDDVSLSFGQTPNSKTDLTRSDLVTVKHPDRTSPYFRKYLKRAVTEYEVLEMFGKKGCIVRLIPKTGRKHQLRVHCAEVLKAPILGDRKYGIRSYRSLYELGWGDSIDFSKYTGVKSAQSGSDVGMPMFLHLRHLQILRYGSYLSDGVVSKADEDLKLTARYPQVWKNIFTSLNVSDFIQRS